jgi:16S rRNA (adenine1518-N6/adenine1519-N6)-dimethyltransferase
MVIKRSKRHALGQHYLHNPRIIAKIIKCISPDENDMVIEIGAGKGALTEQLSEKAGKVIAIEKDTTLTPHLKKMKKKNLDIMEKDVLKVDFLGIAKGKIKLVGNLPYSLSSRILFKVLAEKANIAECHFLLQKEVAERICAHAGSKKFAPLSLFFQNHFLCRSQFTIAPGSFSPPPKVDSTFISLYRRKQPQYPLESEPHFQDFVNTAFQQRRKKIKNNLKLFDLPHSEIEKALSKCGIDSNLRPEQITLSEYVHLFHQLLPLL